MVARDLVEYIDVLRKKRKISLEEFTKDIVSVRQYKRYIQGESDISFSVFSKLVEKLSFSTVRILEGLHEDIAKVNLKLDNYYNLIVSREYKKADKLKQELLETEMVSNELKMYFKASSILLEYYKGEKDKKDCREDLQRLLDYPNVLDKNIHDQTELLVLSVLMMFSNKEEKEELIDKLTKQLLTEKITVGSDFYSRQYVTLRIAREHGLKGNNEEVIKLCENALKYNLRKRSYFNNDMLYYYLSLSYRNINNKQKKEYYITKLKNYLIFLDDDKKYQHYNQLVIKDFGIDLELKKSV